MNVTDRRVLKDKVNKFQKSLENWAKRNGFINRDDTLSISVVVTPALLNMKVSDFFTTERFATAGIKSENYKIRILNMVARTPNMIHPPWAITFPITTVGDITSVTRTQYLKIRDFGPVTLDAMEKILATEGLKIRD